MTKPSQELYTKQYFLSLKTIQRPLTEGHFEPQWIYMHFLLLERSEKQSLYRGFDSISLSRCAWAQEPLPRGSTDLYPEGAGVDTDRPAAWWQHSAMATRIMCTSVCLGSESCIYNSGFRWEGL